MGFNSLLYFLTLPSSSTLLHPFQDVDVVLDGGDCNVLIPFLLQSPDVDKQPYKPLQDRRLERGKKVDEEIHLPLKRSLDGFALAKKAEMVEEVPEVAQKMNDLTCQINLSELERRWLNCFPLRWS